MTTHPLPLSAFILSNHWLLLALLLACFTAVLLWLVRERRRWRQAKRNQRSVAPLNLNNNDPKLTSKQALKRYVRHPERSYQANEVRLLVDGRQAFPEMLSVIDGAQDSVDLETYILRDDGIGMRFQQAMMRAAGRGVHVRLLYDWFGCIGLDGVFVQELLRAGVEVRVYNPLLLLKPSWAVNRRDHRKVLVADGQVAFIGGLNIADDYASFEDGGKNWRDTHVRLDGRQVARRLTLMFDYAWKLAGPFDKAAESGARLRFGIGRRIENTLARRRELANRSAPEEGVALEILGNEEFLFRRRIHRAYLYAIDNARRYILIANAYFLPERSMRRALARAVRRGVTVAIILTQKSDLKVVNLAGRYLYRDLLLSGVRLFEWPLTMMHAKTAVIDDAWAVVGSYNFDRRSLLSQLEIAAFIVDSDFAIHLRGQSLEDIEKCEELALEVYEFRPRYQKILEWAAHLLAPWL
jgi:cardiolipin synthase